MNPPEHDSQKHARELAAFLDMGDDLFREGSEAPQLNGLSTCSVLGDAKIVAGPADETGEVPVYLVKAGPDSPPIGVSLETRNIGGVPLVAHALILLHRLQIDAASEDATPLDVGAAKAMAKVVQWLNVRGQVGQLME